MSDNNLSDKIGKLKCPFCQQKLKTFAKYKDGTSTIYCSKCNLFGDSKLFSELIRTKTQLVTKCNQLKITVDALKRTDWCAQDYAIAQEALDKIKTALEQKDK